MMKNREAEQVCDSFVLTAVVCVQRARQDQRSVPWFCASS